MANIAILVGNSDYHSLGTLACCHDDLLAMRELLEATGKYAEIEIIENTQADDLKSRIRAVIDKGPSTDELLFYFTGHGYQYDSEFFYCTTNFDSKRPNETGLSSSELHTLLRLANADLVVKVVDACNSGTSLVKDGSFAIQQKQGFKNLIQISSCLELQNSLTGDPLSPFTEKFRVSALRKLDEAVYYTDIIYTLRDEFLENAYQTPFFVTQGTGREQFVDNAKRFDGLRAKLAARAASSPPPLAPEGQEVAPAAPSLQELLQKAELRMGTREQMGSFVGAFFDNLIEKISMADIANFFEMIVSEHSDFKEETARGFIIRVLSKEPRPDNFVTATITRKWRRSRWASAAAVGLLGMLGDDADYQETYDLGSIAPCKGRS